MHATVRKTNTSDRSDGRLFVCSVSGGLRYVATWRRLIRRLWWGAEYNWS